MCAGGVPNRDPRYGAHTMHTADPPEQRKTRKMEFTLGRALIERIIGHKIQPGIGTSFSSE